jgi:hypothetical protein
MTETQQPRGGTDKPSELEQRLKMSKRRFMRVFLGSAAAYSVPLLASFSMEGLGVSKAHAFGSLSGGFRSFFVSNVVELFEDNLRKLRQKFDFFSSNQTLKEPD